MSERNNSTTAQPAAEYVGLEVLVSTQNGSRHHCISEDDSVSNIEQGPEDISLIMRERGQQHESEDNSFTIREHGQDHESDDVSFAIRERGQHHASDDVSFTITGHGQHHEYAEDSFTRSEQGHHDVVEDIIYISNEIPRSTLADTPLINSDQVLVNATSTVDIFTPPPLPEDKIFHAMICYESEDRQWARAIYTELESEPYSLKCCISDIHFLASMPILQNIEVNINLYKQITSYYYQTIWISNNLYS